MAEASKRRILVVDDDRLVLATVAHGLSQAGYEVTTADNGDDAILLARQQRPDLALLDIRMEGLSGFDVAAYLREHLKVPFMFLSAFADADTARQVRELGAVAYLVKPLDIGQILPAVADALARLGRAEAEADVVPPAAGSNSGPLAAATTAVTYGPASPASPASTPVAAAALARVPLAVGVLMHRYSLQRQAALERLTRLARDEGCSLDEQARRLVDAVELLSRGQA